MKIRHVVISAVALMFAVLTASASPPSSPGASTPTTQNAVGAKERLLNLVAKRKVREVDVDLCRVGDDNAGCEGAICSCCKADGCYICNDQWEDCVLDSKFSKKAKKRAIRAPEATTVSPGANTGSDSNTGSGDPKKPVARPGSTAPRGTR